jgi:hypothetical protein
VLNQKEIAYLQSSAKFLNLAFKFDKIKTKHKNSALCYSEKLASFYTLRFIHNTVGKHTLNERTQMNKIEKILGFGAIFFMLLRLIINYPYSALLIALSTFILSLIYLFFSFKLLKGNKEESVGKKSSLRETGIILTGISLSLVVIGILYKFLSWSYGNWILMYGLLFLIIILIISIFKFSQTKAEFYKNLVVRIVIIGGFGALMLFTKNETLLEIKYRNFPDYVEAEKKLMQDPMNKELEIRANEERQKMHQSE